MAEPQMTAPHTPGSDPCHPNPARLRERANDHLRAALTLFTQHDHAGAAARAQRAAELLRDLTALQDAPPTPATFINHQVTPCP